ncbi:Uncharacterised protein [Phocoenobacter uteri]|uniref:Uncharacterized protein n=1 Tax=Phocoenobacter uteri TaxID=146806 RepID=A0A379C9M9_9PAST|nr:Uncharacterised protein [Phocoenobacter uteri]
MNIDILNKLEGKDLVISIGILAIVTLIKVAYSEENTNL